MRRQSKTRATSDTVEYTTLQSDNSSLKSERQLLRERRIEYIRWVSYLSVALMVIGWTFLLIGNAADDVVSRTPSALSAATSSVVGASLGNNRYVGPEGEIVQVYDRRREWQFRLPESQEVIPGIQMGQSVQLESLSNLEPCFIIDDPTILESAFDPGNGSEPFIGASGECYGPILEGARIRTSASGYGVDPVNNGGLPEEFVLAVIEAAAYEWDCETGENVFGSRSSAISVDGFDSVTPDGKNEIMFGDAGNPNIIAVTVVWIDSSTRTIVEWDILFNEMSHSFGDSTLVSGRQDFQSIAVHEMGHALGLRDITPSRCGDVTMYYSSRLDETHKRSIESDDRTGLLDLYNNPTAERCSGSSVPPPAAGGSGGSTGDSNLLRINFVTTISLMVLIGTILS